MYYNRAGPGSYENDVSRTGCNSSMSTYSNPPSYTFDKKKRPRNSIQNYLTHNIS